MRYTLWRGDILFGRGEFALSPKDPRLVAGPIEHSTEMEEAGPLWQQRVSHQGVSLVHQQTIPPASTGSAEARVPIYASAEPVTQVSTSEMLVVRDADGRAVATEMICIFGPPTAAERYPLGCPS